MSLPIIYLLFYLLSYFIALVTCIISWVYENEEIRLKDMPFLCTLSMVSPLAFALALGVIVRVWYLRNEDVVIWEKK